LKLIEEIISGRKVIPKKSKFPEKNAGYLFLKSIYIRRIHHVIRNNKGTEQRPLD
jgi:hypothetical protein